MPPTYAELRWIAEIRRIGEVVCEEQRSKNLLVNLIPDVGFALERHHFGISGRAALLMSRSRRRQETGVAQDCVVADAV
jgi:hypothetical protein